MKEKFLKKIDKSIRAFIRASLIISIGIEIYSQNWLTLFISFIALILTFLPDYFEKKYEINLPRSFELSVLFFIYLSLYLGEIYQFYFKFWWWDLFLHLFAAINLGLIGFLIMIYLYRDKKLRANPLLICIFAFSFAVAIGAIWEIFEFFLDQTFNLNMQKSGLLDTMSDLIIDSFGAFISSAYGYIYLKTKKKKGRSFISRFIRENYKLFQRR
jgi:hypothetical protein